MLRNSDQYPNAKQRLSLRVQLSLWVVLIFTLTQWVITMFVWVILSNAIYNEFNSSFVRHSDQVATTISTELPGLTRNQLADIETNQLGLIRFQNFSIDVFDTDGNRLTEPGILTAQLDAASITAAINTTGAMLLKEVNWISTPQSFDGSGTIVTLQRVTAPDATPYIVLQATDDQYAQNRVMQLSQTLLVMSLAAPILGLLAGWFISRIAVSPLLRIQELVETLNPESLDEPLEIQEQSAEVMDLVAQIDDSRDQIRRAFQSQARFLSNVSHELKTPIAVMQIESETVDLDGSSDEVKGFVRSVRDEMTRLGKMVESFLTLTRIEDGFGNIASKRYAFNDLVMDTIDQCLSMSNQNGIELVPVLFSEEDTIGLAAQGDSDLLITMLNNLVRNAIRYSPAGGTVQIQLNGSPHQPTTSQFVQNDSAQNESAQNKSVPRPDQQHQHTVNIRVSDQGPGIPPDQIDHIFDRFAKVECSDRSGRGHGLGLAIAQGIAELHGGEITVINNPGKGCSFTVTLPAINPPD